MSKHLVFAVMSLVFILGCDSKNPDKKTENQDKKTDSQKQCLQQKIIEISKLHNANVSWMRYFQEQEFGTVCFTSQFEQIFLSNENNPFLFVTEIVDVKKQGAAFVITANAGGGWENYYSIDLVLQCAPSLAETVLKRKHNYLDGNTYIFVVTVETVKNPLFRLEAVAESDEKTGDVLESYVNLRLANNIIITGTCIDIVFVGNYTYSVIEWWKDDEKVNN